ncbi:hypothetical protein D8674_013399 [Pyrus ussuriensis x Pyrus communis]|uniref:Uncharacterized protein n=1 Tax=Pyrus ussuriensis x Pyrus communis TaxID=2448454 RepID=A0A5N5GWM5_9ROSA|nr:hypothetical protein D8674_013399 [Pyrus ussuriensis x Pyrus communis]
MSHLIRSRKAVITAPRSIPPPSTSAATALVEMDPRPVNLVDPVDSVDSRISQASHTHRYPRTPTQHHHPLLMPRGHNKAMLDKVRTNVRDYFFDDINDNMLAYVNRLFTEQYKQWKTDLHQYFETFDNPQVALEKCCPKEFEDRKENWKKAKANNINLEKKTLLHHLGSRPFSYRMKVWRQRSMYLQTFMFDPGMTSDPYRHLGSDSRSEAGDVLELRVTSSSKSKGNVIALTEEATGLRSKLTSYKSQMSLIVKVLSESRIRHLDIRTSSTSKPFQLEHA